MNRFEKEKLKLNKLGYRVGIRKFEDYAGMNPEAARLFKIKGYPKDLVAVSSPDVRVLKHERLELLSMQKGSGYWDAHRHALRVPGNPINPIVKKILDERYVAIYEIMVPDANKVYYNVLNKKWHTWFYGVDLKEASGLAKSIAVRKGGFIPYKKNIPGKSIRIPSKPESSVWRGELKSITVGDEPEKLASLAHELGHSMYKKSYASYKKYKPQSRRFRRFQFLEEVRAWRRAKEWLSKAGEWTKSVRDDAVDSLYTYGEGLGYSWEQCAEMMEQL